MKILLSLLLGLAPAALCAQQSATPPTLEEMAGDYVIINHRTYEGVTSVAETRNFTIEVTEDDSLLISNFYMKGGLSFKAGYNPSNGTITVAAGTKIFGYSDGIGTVQTLWAYNESDGTVNERPFTYRLQANGTWKCSSYLVLQSGEAGSTSYTYYDFGNPSILARANGTVNNVTYDGEQVKFEETRPCFVEIKGQYLTVYNLLQKDSYGYGCWLELYFNTSTGLIAAAPSLIGSASSDLEYPYKALTGCEYDEENFCPTGATYAGTAQEGFILGTYDEEAGKIVLPPMAVWPASYDDEGWTVDYTRYYEVEESVEVTFDVASAKLAAITTPLAADNAASPAVRTDFYDLSGRRLAAPAHGQLVVKRTTHADGSISTEKIFVK